MQWIVIAGFGDSGFSWDGFVMNNQDIACRIRSIQ